jgi:hypothetical protein
MFNIFEQPWLLFAAAFVALMSIYVSTLERKLYWLSLLNLILFAVLNLLLKDKIFFLNPRSIALLKILIPIAAGGLSIWLIISIVQLQDRSAYTWLLPLILLLTGFGFDWLVKTDMEKIKAAINTSQRACRQEDIKLFSSIVSDNYQDSFHIDKQALLGHFKTYFSEPLCDSITKTFIQTNKRDSEATVTVAYFIIFNQDSFVSRDYGVLTAKVALRMILKKEADRQWRISKAELVEVNNQPFNWATVSR